MYKVEMDGSEDVFNVVGCYGSSTQPLFVLASVQHPEVGWITVPAFNCRPWMDQFKTAAGPTAADIKQAVEDAKQCCGYGCSSCCAGGKKNTSEHSEGEMIADIKAALDRGDRVFVVAKDWADRVIGSIEELLASESPEELDAVDRERAVLALQELQQLQSEDQVQALFDAMEQRNREIREANEAYESRLDEIEERKARMAELEAMLKGDR